MKLEQVRYAYFVGIGGIGMSAIARWFRAQGIPVAGYDRTRTPLTEQLEAEGIAVHFEDNLALVPEPVKSDKEGSLIVFTPAIPKQHSELTYFQENGYHLMKRAQVLGLLTSGHFTVGVAGTHGKTTTSSMIAHLLHEAGVNCTAFLGGIATNFNSNFLLAAKPENQVIVVEADEYDRSFLTLHPDLAVVTSTDPDHLDIYGAHDALKDSFRQFVAQIQPEGKLILQSSLREDLRAKREVLYSLAEGEVRTENLRVEEGIFRFDIITPQAQIADCALMVPGFHNVENALAAVTVALELGVTANKIRAGLDSYRGVKRRFEYVFRSREVVYIDDYAHHPREIEAFLTSVRALYPGKQITVVFQPHLFTRTRDFAEGFGRSLSLADEVLLLDIYPAREEPIPKVNSTIIFERLTVDKKRLATKEKVLELLEKSPNIEVLCTVGAGDIDTLVRPIKKWLGGKYEQVG